MKLSAAINRMTRLNKTTLLVVLVVVVSAIALSVNHYHRKNHTSLSEQFENAPAGSPKEGLESDQKPAEPIPPTPIEWKDNINSELGFSFKYPCNSQWSISQGKNTAPNNGRIYTSSVVYHETTSKEGINAFELVVAKKGSSQDFNLQNIKTVMAENDFFELAKEERVNIGGLDGIMLAYQAKKSDQGNIQYYFFEKDEIVYNVVINYLGNKSETVDVVDFGDQILKSLEFAQ